MHAPAITDATSHILADEISFQPHSFADDGGRLFYWKGSLLRGIHPKHTPLFTRLFSKGVIQNLVERRLLIETAPTDLCVEGFGMVVSHRVIPFISYPNEWCAAMLKDAALNIIDLAIELADQGLTLKDAHPWNVLFDACRPVYVDLTSIVPQESESGWPAFDEFCRFCYYPLILMSHGQERIARALLPEYEGIRREELFTLIRGSAPSRFVLSKLINRGLRSVKSAFKKRRTARQVAIALLKNLKADLERIQSPSYEDRMKPQMVPSLESRSGWTPQQRTVCRILSELRPSAVLDVSRGDTWSSTLPAALGYEVVSIDSDPSRVTSVYNTANEKNLPILPLLVDFIKPTPSVGYSDHYSIAATERLRCDVVLAFDLANEVARENHFNVEMIAQGLSAFSKRWLVAEVSERCGDLTFPLDGFINSLNKRFGYVEVTSIAEGKSLLLCEK